MLSFLENRLRGESGRFSVHWLKGWSLWTQQWKPPEWGIQNIMEPMFPMRWTNTYGLFSKNNTAAWAPSDITLSLIPNRWYWSKSRARSISPQLLGNGRPPTALDTWLYPLFVSVVVCGLYTTDILPHFILNRIFFQLHLGISCSLRTCPYSEPTSTLESHLIKNWLAQYQDHRGNICFGGLSFLWGMLTFIHVPSKYQGYSHTVSTDVHLWLKITLLDAKHLFLITETTADL